MRRRLYEQLGNIHSQRLSQAIEHFDCRIERAALDPAHVATVDIGVERQAFLRDPLRYPQPPQMPRHTRPPVHE